MQQESRWLEPAFASVQPAQKPEFRNVKTCEFPVRATAAAGSLM
jgi:hypothetical protein